MGKWCVPNPASSLGQNMIIVLIAYDTKCHESGAHSRQPPQQFVFAILRGVITRCSSGEVCLTPSSYKASELAPLSYVFWMRPGAIMRTTGVGQWVVFRDDRGLRRIRIASDKLYYYNARIISQKFPQNFGCSQIFSDLLISSVLFSETCQKIIGYVQKIVGYIQILSENRHFLSCAENSDKLRQAPFLSAGLGAGFDWA